MTVNVTEPKNTVTVNGVTRVITVKTQGTQGANFSSLNKSMIDTNVADGSIPFSITDSRNTLDPFSCLAVSFASVAIILPYEIFA